MKRINTVWLALALSAGLTGVTVQAHAAQERGASSPPSTHDAQPPSPHAGSEQSDAKAITGPYRLTYTLTLMDGAKRIGSQRYEIVQDANSSPANINLDSLVPIHLGFPTSPQYDKEHIGIKISSRLRQTPNGMELSAQITQTGFVQETHNGGTEPALPPVTRVAWLMTAVLLNPHKPITIGRLDLPDSTQVLTIQVEMHKLQ